MKKYIYKTMFILSIGATALIGCTNADDIETPPFTYPYFVSNFTDHPAGVGVNLDIPGTINANLTNTPLWEVRSFSGNKYMQFSAFNSEANTTDNVWFVLPEANLESNKKATFSFDVAQAFLSNGFPLKAYYSLNFDGNQANISSATWTELPFSFPSSSPNYEFVKIKNLIYLNESTEAQNIYFALNYKGAKTDGSSTMIQVDNIKLLIN